MVTAATITITRENITCRKCRVVGLKNFVRRSVYVAGGEALDVISCLICSDWYSSRPLTEKMERSVPPVKDRGLGTCYVTGCGNTINPAMNKSGLCTNCGNRLDRWRRSGEKGLPPLIRTPTGYMTRAAFQALTPPEVNHVETPVSPVSVVQPAPAKVKRNPEAGAVAGERRNDQPGIAALSQILAEIALPAPLEVIATWSPAEVDEVIAFAAACNAVKKARKMPDMPDVLVPLYDELYAERKTA